MNLSRYMQRLMKKLRVKKTRFIRVDSWRYRRLRGKSWRKPKTTKSKVRRKLKGRVPMPDPGYSSPRIIRGLHPSGYKPVLVSCFSELSEINPEKEAIILSRTLSKRKKTLIQREAFSRGIKVLNPVTSIQEAE